MRRHVTRQPVTITHRPDPRSLVCLHPDCCGTHRWPCRFAKREILAHFRGRPNSLLLYLGRWHAVAVDLFPYVSAGELYRRFIGWAATQPVPRQGDRGMTRTEAAAILRQHKPSLICEFCTQCQQPYPCAQRREALAALPRFSDREVLGYERELVDRNRYLNPPTPARGAFGRF